MANYRCALIVPTPRMTHEDILDVADALGENGCTDATIRGHDDGMEVLFERSGDSLQAAIASAISEVEQAGYRISKIEREREAIAG